MEKFYFSLSIFDECFINLSCHLLFFFLLNYVLFLFLAKEVEDSGRNRYIF